MSAWAVLAWAHRRGRFYPVAYYLGVALVAVSLGSLLWVNVDDRAAGGLDCATGCSFTQTFALWLPKKPGKITGGELRGDTATLDLEGEIFEGTPGLFLVRMVKRGDKWVFDRATRAGFIDSK